MHLGEGRDNVQKSVLSKEKKQVDKDQVFTDLQISISVHQPMDHHLSAHFH